MTGSKQVQLVFDGIIRISLEKGERGGKKRKRGEAVGDTWIIFALNTTKKGRTKATSWAAAGWPNPYILALLLATISSDSLVVFHLRDVAIFASCTTSLSWHQRQRLRLEKPIRRVSQR